MKVTIERMREAYQRTGAQPMAGDYYQKEGETIECCVLSVLYLDQFGVEKLEQLLFEYETTAYLMDPVLGIASDLDIDLDFAKGVMEGFDGLAPYEGYPISGLTYPESYDAGYVLGAVARREFIES